MNRDPDAAPDPGGDREPPPLLGSWGRLYALVVVVLLVDIVLLGWITERFR